MKTFHMREIREAEAHAMAGGQALHLHNIIVNRLKAPRCFVAAVDRGEMIAHLFDQDAARLNATVKKLGVRIVVIERVGEPGQHVDLCAGPLAKARAMADKEPAPGVGLLSLFLAAALGLSGCHANPLTHDMFDIKYRAKRNPDSRYFMRGL